MLNIFNSFLSIFYKSETSSIDSVPEDCLILIFSCLQPIERTNLESTCKRFYSISSDPRFKFYSSDRLQHREKALQLSIDLWKLIDKIGELESTRFLSEEESALRSISVGFGTFAVLAKSQKKESDQLKKQLIPLFLKSIQCLGIEPTGEQFSDYVDTTRSLLIGCARLRLQGSNNFSFRINHLYKFFQSQISDFIKKSSTETT